MNSPTPAPRPAAPGSDWIQTYTGRKFYPLAPDPGELDIEDIAHALSNICRFTGHTRRFYCVAEHSVHVHDLLSRPNRLAGLLHDATEAYLCDLARPLKRSDELCAPYFGWEDRLAVLIAAKFGFLYPYAPTIHAVDDAVLMTEIAQLMTPVHRDWPPRSPVVPGLILPCWTPARAREEFLNRYHDLTGPIIAR